MHAKKILLLITCICTIILWNDDFSIAQEKQANSEVFQLGEVVVSEKRETINLATTITEVTEQDIISQGAQTVAEALNLIPGLYVEVGGKNEAKVQIRGFTQKCLL